MSALQNIFTAWRARMMVFIDQLNRHGQQPEQHCSQREQIIVRMRELQRRANAETAALQRQIDDVDRDVRSAELRVNTLYAELQNLWGKKLTASLRVQREVGQLQSGLAACSPPELEKLLMTVNEEIDGCRRIPVMDANVSGRLGLLQRVRREAEALRIAPIPMAEALTELRNLERNVASASGQRINGLMAVSH